MVNREELIENLNNSKFMYLTLMKLDKYLQKFKMRHVITSDCGNVQFRFYPDDNIHIQVKYASKDLDNLSYRTATLNYKVTNEISYNNVDENYVYYSSLNKKCTVGCSYEYKIDYPYEHSEEEYFQNLTRYDLPDEFYYKEACEFLQLIKDIELMSFEVNMISLSKEHIESIKKLLTKMDLNDVEYY